MIVIIFFGNGTLPSLKQTYSAPKQGSYKQRLLEDSSFVRETVKGNFFGR
jgi:hypothetical protein